MPGVETVILDQIKGLRVEVQAHRELSVSCKTTVQRELGELSTRVAGQSKRIDALNGRVGRAITSATEAKAVARTAGRRSGAIVAAAALGAAGAIVAAVVTLL